MFIIIKTFYFGPSTIKEYYTEAHTRLVFGSHETSPIIWIGKPSPGLMAGRSRGGWGRTGGEVKTTENKILWLR
jgi:hypothetical protein